MNRGKARRRQLTEAFQKKQERLYRAVWASPLPAKIGYYKKRHVFDCGRPKCYLCHSARRGHPRKYDDFYYDMAGDLDKS